jgi:hypothetical protein
MMKALRCGEKWKAPEIRGLSAVHRDLMPEVLALVSASGADVAVVVPRDAEVVAADAAWLSPGAVVVAAAAPAEAKSDAALPSLPDFRPVRSAGARPEPLPADSV